MRGTYGTYYIRRHHPESEYDYGIAGSTYRSLAHGSEAVDLGDSLVVSSKKRDAALVKNINQRMADAYGYGYAYPPSGYYKSTRVVSTKAPRYSDPYGRRSVGAARASSKAIKHGVPVHVYYYGDYEDVPYGSYMPSAQARANRLRKAAYYQTYEAPVEAPVAPTVVQLSTLPTSGLRAHRRKPAMDPADQVYMARAYSAISGIAQAAEDMKTDVEFHRAPPTAPVWVHPIYRRRGRKSGGPINVRVDLGSGEAEVRGGGYSGYSYVPYTRGYEAPDERVSNAYVYRRSRLGIPRYGLGLARRMGSSFYRSYVPPSSYLYTSSSRPGQDWIADSFYYSIYR